MRAARCACLALTFLAALAGGCKKKQPAAKTEAAAQKGWPKVEVPREVMVYVGQRAPGRTIDDALVLVRKFLPVMHTRRMVLDQLADNIRIPREVMGAVEMTGTLWLVKLDDQLAGTRDGNVVVFPVTSKAAFEKALTKRMKKAGTEGKLTLYKARPDQLGLQPVRLLVSGKHVFVASDQKSLKLTEAFIRGNLLAKKPAHDVEAHVMMTQLMKSRGAELDRNVKAAVGQLRQNVQGGGGAAQLPVNATDQALRRYLALLKATSRVLIGLDVTKENVTVTLRGKAANGGTLQKVIKRQRPGAALATAALPASAWLVWSDRGNPEAQKEGEGVLKPLLEGFLAEMPAKDRLAAQKHVDTITGAFTGDFTLALHRAPSGTGLTLSAVTAVTDAGAAGKAADQLVGQIGALIKAEMTRRKEKMPTGYVTTHRPFSHKSARGVIFSFTYPVQKGKEKEAAMLKKLVGNPFSAGWAFSGKQMMVVVGAETAEQLKRLVEGKPAGSPLAGKADFKVARQGKNRLGQLYISLLDFIRWFDGSGNPDVQAVVDSLEGVKGTTAPSLSWGVSDDRSELELTLRLSADHFLAVMPVADTIKKKNLGAKVKLTDVLPVEQMIKDRKVQVVPVKKAPKDKSK